MGHSHRHGLTLQLMNSSSTWITYVLGLEWYPRACHCQALFDATGDSHEWRQLNRANTPAATPQQYFNRTFTISFITDLLSEMEPLFRKCIKVMTWMEPMNITSDCIWITRTLSFLSNCPKMQVRDRHTCWPKLCMRVCVRARACMRLRKGIVLRVCLQVSCGAPS